mgnify:FL=1
MTSSELSMILDNIETNLSQQYRLNGERQKLSEFTGVVMTEGKGQEYYEWEEVSLQDNFGIQLSSLSGRIYTHSVSYFSQQLRVGKYAPAVYDAETDHVSVARKREDHSPSDS